MRLRSVASLGSIIVLASTALASPPRVHRGPTCPKLFSPRVPSPASKPAPKVARGPQSEAGAVEQDFQVKASASSTLFQGESSNGDTENR